MPKLEFYLNKIIHYGLYAILLTPLVFWPPALYAFMTPKFILFQVLVEIVFAAWLFLIIYKSRLISVVSDLRRSYIVLALSGFFAASFLSAVLGVDFSRSFWGIGARMTGMFAELHFFAWFLVLYSYFKNNKEKWFRYINFSFLVSTLVAFSAFFQNTDWRLVYGSTFFNNPTFVAPYFLFHFFWGLYQTLNFKKLQRWLFGLAAALLAFVIFLGEVRGAILGLFIGLFIFSLDLIFTDVISRRFKILISAFFIAIFMGFSGLWFMRNSAFVQNASALKRLTQVSITQTTVQTRFIVWRLTALGFKSNGWRTILGAGPENFNYFFNANYNPALLKYGIGETWFDKPHNAFLQILSEIGIIGGIAYLLILIAVALAIFKLFKTGQKILTLTLTGAFIAYLISMFFSFDSFGSWFALFLFLAFLASHNNTNDANQYTNDANKEKNFLFRNIFVTFVLIGIFALEYFNYGIWRANIANADALRVFSHDPVQGIAYFKKSFDYFTPYKAEYQFDFIASVAGALQRNLPVPQLEDNLNLALDGADEAIKAHPKNAAFYTDMVTLYNILGEKGRNPAILNQAETFGKKSLELSPNRQETMFYLARTALLKNDTKTAVIWAKQAVSADPSINQSHWYLGLAYIADNQRQEGLAEIKKALESGYKLQNQAEASFVKSLGL